MRSRLVFLFAFFATAALCAEPPHVKPNTLPSWWPNGLFAHSDVVVAEDYGQANFATGPKPAGRERPMTTVRGRHWHAYLVRLPEEAKANQHPDGFAKWEALKRDLGSKGFRVIDEEVRKTGSYQGVYASLRRGEGDAATWVFVDISHPFNTGAFEAVEVAPNPFSIEVKPPAATPESFTDKDNFPYLTPEPGARFGNTSHWKHPMDFKTGDSARGVIKIGTGYTEKYYKGDPTISAIAFQQAYTAALEKAGWTVMPTKDTAGVSAAYEKNGRDIYAYLTRSSFAVADVGQELAAALAKNCKASVYGINFDFDKATLRPDSTPTLEQVLKVLKDDPKLNVEIGGHTDNVGKPDYNLGLSDRRAASVKDWLVAHGIASSRLTSHGYGDTQPVVPNTSEENRAMNRRVELKKPGCK